MSNVQKLKVNSQTNIYEASGAIAAAGSVFDVSSATGATNLIALAGDGNTGVTLGATMTVDPELTAESGYLTITVAGVAYQIPIYAA
jgi:hypothetical protein